MEAILHPLLALAALVVPLWFAWVVVERIARRRAPGRKRIASSNGGAWPATPPKRLGR